MLAGLQRGEHGRLHDVHADRHVGHALVAQDVGDLPGRAGEEAGLRRHRSPQPDHPAAHVLREQPRAVQAVVLRRRAEVPQVRLAAAGEEREARHLVARPLPDVGARDVADVVEVEDQQGAQLRCLERLADAVEPVVPQPLGVDALLPVDGLESRGADRSGGHLAAPLARSRRAGASCAGLCSGTAIVARDSRGLSTPTARGLRGQAGSCSAALERWTGDGPAVSPLCHAAEGEPAATTGSGRHRNAGRPPVYGCSNRMEASTASSSSVRIWVYAAAITTRVPSTS